jgi:hypothetical protein
MNDRKPLSLLTERLEEGCLFCGRKPSTILVNGPDELILQPCGHVHDAEDWLDEMWESGQD